MPGPKRIGTAAATLSTGEKEHFFVYADGEEDADGLIAVRSADAWRHRPSLPPMRVRPDCFCEMTLNLR
ncbi:hypothetical protein [Streptomyces sp. TLI_171]|uniref:hypothetical protein n=1 Tax=Streptomyces sp. TLI_171 TaxID=1938859 RepID=UPI000C197E96|nr:hypothetical protein [Streptomyces sp. TLI_171]RKE05017.1 hypothetical protein BX266_7260 [Streptomyces sp. TLI_171]